VTRQVHHLSRLIDDLLDVSRITRGKISLKKSLTDVATIVERAAEAVRHLVDERHHELIVSVPTERLQFSADPTRLEQMLVNLLSNSAKYTQKGGKIWLSVHRQQTELILSVRDTGIGIPPDLLPRVFDLFVQGDRSIARSEGGLGIGLTLVQKLAEMHGGTVTARSDGPGKGSEFVIRLPMTEIPGLSG
jgi:signal transduction histidine kinase